MTVQKTVLAKKKMVIIMVTQPFLTVASCSALTMFTTTCAFKSNSMIFLSCHDDQCHSRLLCSTSAV